MTQANKDLFISHSSKDRDFVERLCRDLTSNGVKVWWAEWEMKVGDSLNRKIQQGILGSSWLGVVLSPDSVRSPWVERELNAALITELELRQIFVLPILYKACDVPLFLREKVYADFRTFYGQGLRAILKRISPSVNPITCVPFVFSPDDYRNSDTLDRLKGILSKTEIGVLESIADSKNIDAVYVSGTFNGWNAKSMPMKRDPSGKGWKCELYLPTGIYEYQFRVLYDDKEAWVPDHRNRIKRLSSGWFGSVVYARAWEVE